MITVPSATGPVSKPRLLDSGHTYYIVEGNSLVMIALSAQGLHRVATTGRTETSILHGCDLELRGGGLTAVVGHSGSGKSSLLMCLSGLDEPTSGTVTINGRDVYQQSAAKRAKMLRSEVGFVFQQYNLVPFLTVEENIALPFLLDHEPAPHDLVRDLIESFGLSRCSRTPAACSPVVNSSEQRSAGRSHATPVSYSRTSQQVLWIRRARRSFSKPSGEWPIRDR